MGYEKRGIDPGPPNGSNQQAENDDHYSEYVYNDTSGGLSIGMPLYKDVTDSGEFNASNNKYATLATFKTAGVVTRSGGTVVLGTNASAGANLTCVGLYQPENPSELPVNGQVVRVLDRGSGVVSAQSPAGGAAGTVGGSMIASAAVKQAVPGARSTGLNIGIFTATRASVTPAAALAGLTAASATVTLVNCFVALG
jgi:hypothetical protein